LTPERAGDRPEDLGGWIEQLTRRSAAYQAEALRRYCDLLQAVARGELSEQGVREELVCFARDESARHARALAALSLGYYDALLEATRAYNERLFERLLGSRTGGAGDRPRRRQFELALCGRVGESASGSFIIENRRAEPVDVSYVVSEFRDSCGGPEFRPPLLLSPPRLRLPPGHEQRVGLQLSLPPELFAPGRQWQPCWCAAATTWS
jgi:hypothetical protein